MHKFWFGFLILAGIVLITACNSPGFVQPTPSSTPSPTRTVTAAPSDTSLPMPSDTPSAVATSTRTITPRPQPTHTRRVVVIASDTPTRTAAPAKRALCPGAPDSMLALEAWAMVSLDPPLPNNVRSEPGSSSKVIGMVQPGEILQITDGPQCADGYTWWYIHSAHGLEGWTAEGDAGGYWIVPLQPVVDWATDENTVTLTAGQVRSAVEIEGAIQTATARGTRPGVVILDGRDGPFVYTQPDESINIFVSDLALVGINQARIQGCGDGLFFDNFPLRNILVEGIEFVCDGHGVWTGSAFEAVTIRNNVFRTGLAGFMMGGASSDWLISGNKIESESNGMEITAGKNFIITKNDVTGYTGILLRQCYDFTVSDNTIWGRELGVQLIQKAARNLIEKNVIQEVRTAGVLLETGVSDNLILENSVMCAPGTSCKTVEAAPAVLEVNTIRGNTP
jgi:hypothetical protein